MTFLSDFCDTFALYYSTQCFERCKISVNMKEKIRQLLEDALTLVDFDSDFLFSELDSLGVTTIMMLLSDEYGIQLDATDATPRNLRSLDSIVELVKSKL